MLEGGSTDEQEEGLFSRCWTNSIEHSMKSSQLVDRPVLISSTELTQVVMSSVQFLNRWCVFIVSQLV